VVGKTLEVGNCYVFASCLLIMLVQMDLQSLWRHTWKKIKLYKHFQNASLTSNS